MDLQPPPVAVFIYEADFWLRGFGPVEDLQTAVIFADEGGGCHLFQVDAHNAVVFGGQAGIVDQGEDGRASIC